MKNILLFAFSILLFSSCGSTRYQITTIESNSVDELFTFANEEIALEYNFWDFGGDLKFNIVNRTNKPIFVDWEHSNFIFNDYSYNYYSNEETMTLTEVGIYSRISTADFQSVIPVATKRTRTTGSFKREQKSIQIPPRSYIAAKVINLGFPWINFKGDEINFGTQNSPLRVRTYLGYSYNQDLRDLKYVDNEFYVKNITEIKKGKFNKSTKQKNRFYTKSKRLSVVRTLITAGSVSVGGILAFYYFQGL